MAEPFLGQISMFAGTYAPKGWMFCNGDKLAISKHQSLFSLLGTTYGGDGQNSFALPDLRSRAPVHAGAGHDLPEVSLGDTGGIVPKVDEPGSAYNAGPYTAVNFIIAVEGVYPSRGD